MLFWFYCLGLVAIGIYWRRSARDTAGYFLASRSLSAWQVGLAMAATAFGGSAILIASQLVYSRGMAGIWFSLAVGLGFGVLGFGFAERIRQTQAHSLADYIGKNFGETAHWLASLLLIVVELGFFGLTVKSFALLARPLLPASATIISDRSLQVAVCAIFVSYTMLGGHKADVIADIARLAIVGIALLGVLLPVSLLKANWNALPVGHLNFPFNSATNTGPLYVLNMLVLMGLPSIVGGDVFAKVLSSQSGTAARRGMLLAFAVRSLLAFVVAGLALCARTLLPDLVDSQQAQAVPLLAKVVLPAILFQLIALALLSALLSTSDSVLITMSTVLALDILRLGERAPIWASRLATLAVAVAGLSLAIYFQELLEMIRFSYTLLAAGIAAPVLVALVAHNKKIGAPWFIAAMLTGVGMALAWKWEGPRVTKIGLESATFGAACAVIVMSIAIMTADKSTLK